MTTPERSVEEIASGILICICSDRGDKELCKNCGKPTVKAQVKKILTQERQKREVVVEELETMRIFLLRNEPTVRVNMGGGGASDYYQQGQLDVLEKVIYKLTHPNKTK